MTKWIGTDIKRVENKAAQVYQGFFGTRKIVRGSQKDDLACL